MHAEKSVRVSFVGAGDVLQHIIRVRESKYGMLFRPIYPAMLNDACKTGEAGLA